MSRKQTLDTKVLRAVGIISFFKYDVEENKRRFLDFCSRYDNCENFYFIVHDDDTSNLHLHFIICCYSQVRLSTLLNKIAQFMDIDTNSIGLEKLTNINSMLRYFLHLDESPEKKRYSTINIISSESIQTLQNYIDTDDDTINVKRLFQLVMKFDEEIDLLYYLGLSVYHKYRYEIKLLYDRRTDVLINYKQLRLDENKDLPF